MKHLTRIVSWSIIGAVFGTTVGALARGMGYPELTGGILAGMVAAPAMMVFLLFAAGWPGMLRPAVIGAMIGAVGFAIVSAAGDQAIGYPKSFVATLRQVGAQGALFGGVVAAWFVAGRLLFDRQAQGFIGLLGAIVAGAFMGAAVWALGQVIGGEIARLAVGDWLFVWRWGETIAGVPIGVGGGYLATQLLTSWGVKA